MDYYGTKFEFDLQLFADVTLSEDISGMNTNDSKYYKADGTEGTEVDHAYVLKKTADDAYTLTSTETATSAQTFDASGVTGLTIDFSLGDGKKTVTTNSATVITAGTFKANDVVGGATVGGKGKAVVSKVADEAVTLKEGTFAATADMKIAVTDEEGKQVVLNTSNIFGQSAAAVYTNSGTAITLTTGSMELLPASTATVTANGATVKMAAESASASSIHVTSEGVVSGLGEGDAFSVNGVEILVKDATTLIIDGKIYAMTFATDKTLADVKFTVSGETDEASEFATVIQNSDAVSACTAATFPVAGCYLLTSDGNTALTKSSEALAKGEGSNLYLQVSVDGETEERTLTIVKWDNTEKEFVALGEGDAAYGYNISIDATDTAIANGETVIANGIKIGTGKTISFTAVTKGANISGLRTGDSVATASENGTDDVYTVNNVAYKVNRADARALTFTVAAAGTTVSDLANGDKVATGKVEATATDSSTVTFSETGVAEITTGATLKALANGATFLDVATANEGATATYATDALTLNSGTYTAVKIGTAISTTDADRVTYSGQFTITKNGTTGVATFATLPTTEGTPAPGTITEVSDAVLTLTGNYAVTAKTTGTVVTNSGAAKLAVNNSNVFTLNEGVFTTESTNAISIAATAAVTVNEDNIFSADAEGTYTYSATTPTATLTAGSVELKNGGKAAAVTVSGKEYKLTAASADGSIVVDSTGTVSKMDAGDTFTIGTNEYTVVNAQVLVGEVAENAFTVYTTGENISATATFKEGTGLAVGLETAKGEAFKSYVNNAISAEHVLTLAANNSTSVQFYGTTEVANVATVGEATTAENVAAAYAAAQYKVAYDNSSSAYVVSGGASATPGTATTVNVQDLGNNKTITFGDGLNDKLVGVVTTDTAFTVSAADRAKLTITQVEDGPDVVAGKVALTLTGAAAQKLTLSTVDASAKLGYVAGDVTATINDKTYHVMTEGKTATVTKGETQDTVAVDASTKILIGAKKYDVGEAAAFVGTTIESGSMKLTSTGDETYVEDVTNDYNSISLPVQQNTDPVKIIAQDFKVGETVTKTEVEVVVENGVATALKGFGNTVGEVVTVGGYDYRVKDATTIQRKAAKASDETYVDMTSVPASFSTSITLDSLTDVLNWGATAGTYTLGENNELTLTDKPFTEGYTSGTKVYNLQKGGETVAVLRQTGEHAFTLEKVEGVAATVSIQDLDDAVIITKGFVEGTDKITADRAASETAPAISFTLNGTKYDVPVKIEESVAVAGEAATNGSKLVTGSVTLKIESDETEAQKANNSVTVADGSVITITGGTAPATITVTAAGVVSGLAADDTFTVKNADGITTTYTVANDAKSIAAEGGYYGKYTITPANIGNITVTSTTGKSNVVTDTTSEATVVKPESDGVNSVDVALSEAEYVLVKVAKSGGTITGYTTETVKSKPADADVKTLAAAADGETIGYFYTKTDTDGKTQVTYTGDMIGMPVNLDAEDIDGTTANMDVTASANSIEVLTLTNVAAGQTVTLNGTAFAGDVTYQDKYEFGGTGKITLVAEPNADTFFKVVVDGEAKKGVQKYQIAAANSVGANDSYFTLTRSGTDGAYTYTITYTTPAEGETGHLALTDASWANLVIDATNVDTGTNNGDTKIVITPAAGVGETAWADQYTVESVKAGVAVEKAQGATADYIKSVAYSNAYTENISTTIELKDYFKKASTTTDVYFEVTSAAENGITTITLGEAVKVPESTAPTTTGKSYLHFSKTGTKITGEYINNDNISLTGLTGSDGSTLVKVNVSASGLTLTDDVTEIDITDNTAAPKFVDYNLTGVPGGVKVTGKGDNDTVTWDNTYKFDITFNLKDEVVSASPKTYYLGYSSKVADENGVKTLALADTDQSLGTFTITYTSGAFTIAYTKGSSIDLGGKIVDGAAIKVNTDGLVKGTTLKTVKVTTLTDIPAKNYVVTNLDKTVTTPSEVVGDLNYLYKYTYAADKVVLGDLQPGATKYFVVTTTAAQNAHTDDATNRSLKGVTTYTVAEGVDTAPAATANYITATNVSGKITLTYHQSTTAADVINLAEGGSQITVDASGLQDDAAVANSIVMTADAKVNYNMTGIPASVGTNITKDSGDTSAYRESFKVTTTAPAANYTMTLANGAGTAYYYVNPGAPEYGLYTVKLEEMAGADDKARLVALAQKGDGGITASSTPNAITEALKKINYFTVTTSADGKVSITYTQADKNSGSVIVKLSGAGNIVVDANGTTADKITDITIEQGGDADYQLTNVRGATTITNKDEGGSTYTVKYATTYVIDGKIELSDATTGIVYYDVTRTVSDTGIVTYKLGAAAATHTESNYFAVNYNNVDQGKVFVSYENVGTSDYNMIPAGKVEIDATALPKTVTTIDISDRSGVDGLGTPTKGVYYDLTDVPATAKTITGKESSDTTTYAYDYAFGTDEKITLAAGTWYIYEEDVTTGGTKTGEKYTFKSSQAPESGTDQGYGSVVVTLSDNTYTVTYKAGSKADPVKLSGGQIALNASGIGTGKTVKKAASDEGSYAIINALGGTKFEGLATNGSDTVKYSTKFAWGSAGAAVSGTYYAAMADTIALKTDADAVVPATGTNYLAVTIDGTEGTVKYAWVTPNETTGVMEAPATTPDFTGRVTLTAPTASEITTWTFDASGFDGLGVDIIDVPDGANITKLGDDTTVTMTATLTNDDMTVAGKKYTAGDMSVDEAGKGKNAITVSSDGVVSGILKLSDGNHTSKETGLVAANKKSGANEAENVWIETAVAGKDTVVTFGANGIESIKGLDNGEVVRVVENGVIYSYKASDNGLLITRTNTTDATDVKVLGLTAEGDTFFGGVTYAAVGSPDTYKTGFSWLTPGTQYVPLGGQASTTDKIDTSVPVSPEEITATAGTYLLAVEVTGTDTKTLTITPKVVNGVGEIVNATGEAAYTGTVTLDAATGNTLPVVLDVTDKTYVLTVTGAKAGSSFTGLGGKDAQVTPQAYNDSVTTAALATGESVTVNGGTYTNAETSSEVLNFAKAGSTTVWGLKTTAAKKFLVTAASGTLTAYGTDNVAELISYAAGTVSDGAVVTINSTETDAVTSITGLTGGESVTVKNGDVTTVYTANDDGTEITRTITDANGTVNTRTITAVTAGVDVLGLAWASAANTVTNTLDWTKDSIGYFKVVNDVAAVTAGETTIASTDTDTYVAAKVTIDAETGVAALTLTGKTVTKGVVGTDTNLAAGKVVKVTLADGTLVGYAKASDTTMANASVQISGAAAGSVFTGMTKDTDQVTTAALAANDAIFFNGKYVISAVENALTIAGSSDGSTSNAPRIVAGSVQVGGTYAGSDETVKTALSGGVSGTAYGSDSVLSVVYTAGTKDGEAKDGVIATFTKGNPTSITGLTNGEKVVVTYTSGATYTYTAMNEAGTEIKCEYDSNGTTAGGDTWTRYCTTMTAGGNILGVNYSAPDTVSIFNWTATKETGATTAVGYFTIDAQGKATVAAQTTPGVTLAADTNYVAVNATTDANGVITLGTISEVTVGKDGAISAVSDDDATVKSVTVTFPANTLGTGKGTTVKVNAPTGRTQITAVTLTNVGANSVLGGGLLATDRIETVSLTVDESVTVNDKKYIAGDTGAMTILGDGRAEDGVFALHTRAASGLSEVTTYYVNPTTMDRVSETISYATTEKNITGAVVTILNGEVTGLTSLGENESVTIVTTTTDKTGTASVVTTTYSAALNDYGTLVYTRTVDTNGVKTVSTTYTATAATDLIAGGGWSTDSTTAKSQFDWTNTGYFLLGENKYDGIIEGTITLAAQDTAVSINKSKYNNMYLEVTSSGNSAKGYKVSSMRLFTVNYDGTFDYSTTPTDLTVNVTAPSAGLTFNGVRDANITLNVTGATAGKFYDGLATGDTIAWSSAASGDKLYVNGVAYVSGAASNAVTLKKTATSVAVTQGTLVVDDDTTLNSSVTNGATVVVGNAGKDGVVVAYGSDGHISSVTDLEATETVTVTETNVETIWEKADDPSVVVTEAVAEAANEAAEEAGEAAAYLKRVVTTTIQKMYNAAANAEDAKKVDVTLTVTTTVAETLDGAAVTAANMKNVASRTETWKKEAVAATEDVISLSGYTTNNAFSWADSKTGYFAIEDGAATIAAQEKAPTISTSATYLKAETNSTTGATTLDKIVALKYDDTLNAWVETDFAGTITIPATGNIDVSAITNRALEAYTINVTGAGTGQTFTGFTADDTIATAATFYANNTITVNGETLTAAADGQIVASGDGKAVSGAFKLQTATAGDTSIELPKNADGNIYTVAYTLPATGAETATVIVKDGAIQEIRDIASGETVTVTITDAKTAKVISTETYAATAGSGADETLITKTVTDGVTEAVSTATLKASEKYSDIYGVSYTQKSNVTTSQFAWTDANYKDGYFATTFDSDANTYTATVADQASPVVIDPSVAGAVGKKYLKVTRSATGTISAISLVELQSDGSFRDVTSNLGTGSVVTITPPAAALTYEKAAGALYGVRLTAAPATGSKITGLKAVDAIGTNAESKYEAGKAFGIATNTTIGAIGMTIATATAAMNVVVNGMRFVASDTAGLTIQANTASDTYLTKGTLVLDTNTADATASQSVKIQKLVKAVAPATEDTTGDKITVTVADTDLTGTVTVDIYGSFDATTLYTASNANAANLTITATDTSGTVIEKYAVDAYGNITATNAAGSTRYALTAAPAGKIILDGTIDSTFDTAALVVDATYDTATGYNKVALLDNSRTTIYASTFAGTEALDYADSTKGQRLLTATYTKAATEDAKDTYAIASDLAANNITEIDTTALTSDKVTINGTNLTTANIKLTDASGTTAVVQLTSGGTMALEAGAISGVTALTLVSGELVNASGLAAGAATGVTLWTSKATVNGVTYKDAYGAVVTAVKDGDNYVSQLYSGSVTAASGDDALALSGGSTVTVTGSVTVTAAAGAVSTISGFTKGEKVAIKTGTTTTTYEAISDTNIKVTTQPDGGTATEKTASYDGISAKSFNPATLVTYDALTTAAGDIDWASTTAKTTYRLVPNSGTADGSTVDLSATSKQSSFSYADAGTNLFATTVTAGTNALTIAVNEITVASDGSLTTAASAADIAADKGKFTLTTGTLTKGTTVTLNGASVDGTTPHTYTTAKDSVLTVNGSGLIENGSLVLTTTLNTKVSGLVTLNGAVSSGTANAVTVTNGKVTAIAGLDVGESVVIGSATDNVTYTAQQRTVEGETVYEIVKTVTKAGVVDAAATATATVTKDTMADEFSLTGGLAFTTEAASVDNEVAGLGQGQFQWSTDARGVGYFLIQKASASSAATNITVQDQSTKTVFTAAESGNTYMVASLDKSGATDVLTLNAQTATVDTTGETVTFADKTFYGTVKLSVAKDYTGTLQYDAPSDRTYNVEFTNVTAGAILSNLGTAYGLADKVTTVSLAENESVTVNDITYTAGAKGSLVFQDGKLYSGTVKLSAAGSSIVTTGNEKKGTASMTVGGANFGDEDGTNEVLVKVANGEITSITGLVNKEDSITVTDNVTSAEYVYSVLDSDGTMIKRTSDSASLYTTIKNGGNVYVTKDTSWNAGVTFGPGGTMEVKNTTMTADSKVWSGNTVRYYRIGTSTDLADDNNVAELVTHATEGAQGEYYIAVTAKDSKITGVTLMQVSATGELKKASTTLEKAYSGTLNIEAETALVYSAPATRSWHYRITGVTADAKITNLNEDDTVITGDVSYAGEVTVDNVKYVSGDKSATQTMTINGGKPDTVTSTGVFAMSNGAKTLTTYDVANGATYTVKYGGGKDELAVTVSNGEVTAITGLGTTADSGTVTLEKVDATGLETTTYTLKSGVITKTVTGTSGTKLTSTAAYASGFELIGGDYGGASLQDAAYNFTWTDAGTTGYFKLATPASAITAKTAKGTIKTTDTASSYLAVTLTNADAASATVSNISVKYMNRADATGMDARDGYVYTGKLTLSVPKGVALIFDRSILGDSTENAAIAVTGIAANSVIKNLNAGETVTTGALNEDEVVTVNSNVLQAGAKNATLKVTSIDAANVLVTGGKVKLEAGNTAGYAEEITVAKDKSTNCIVGVTTGTIVVNATATGFTVEGLGVGEEFTVTEGTTTVSYKVSESTVLRVKDGVTSVYKLSAATIAKGTASIASAVLAKESNWLTSMAYGSDAHVAVTARAKIDLKAADTALTKAEKAGTMMPDYYFVTDEAIDQKTAATKNGAIAATMVETTGKQSWELNIGAVTTDEDVTNDGINDRTYTASDTVGQNIIAANGWKVTGGSGDDTMTGAASGSDTMVGGSGNDSMVGGGANDYFVHTAGKDTITKYTSGKDTVKFESGFATDAVTLDKSDVTLGSSDSDMLVLIGAAASQANGVSIENGDGATAVNYYFGKSTAAANFTKLTDGAYYYGAAGQNNKITVSTDKTKATKTSLGANQTVDLSNTARYHNITEVNASGSANKVLLKANDAATTDTTTLRGGSYMTTLVGGQGHDTMFGGSGNDFFQFNEYSGTDVVSKYDGKKDMLYVAGGLGYWEISSDNKHLYLKSSASDSASIKVENVVGGTAVNIAEDSKGNNVTSYFFGKSKAANTYTGTDDASKGATQHKDVFFVNELANSTTVKLFGVNDEIRIEVSKNYTLSDVMNMLDSKSNATNSIYNIENQKLTISDKSYSMSTSNTEVTMDGTTMTIKRTK